jgi:hypothetical protein
VIKMPYIKEEERSGECPETEGQLAYQLTTKILDYLYGNQLRVKAKEFTPMRFKDYAMAVGIIECVKQELYRRVVAPYEDKKCKENGDVFL